MTNCNALIIFAREPDAETVKTRLKPYMTDEDRVSLYVALMTNTIDRLKNLVDIDTFISYSPGTAQYYFLRFGLSLFPQAGDNLGERMFNAINYVITEGYHKAVLVGTDLPEISSSIALSAFDLLSEKDIVFGPAEDGGYYLVGMKKPMIDIFSGIEWSTDKVLDQSLHKAGEAGLTAAFTKRLSDIDTIEDLRSVTSSIGGLEDWMRSG